MPSLVRCPKCEEEIIYGAKICKHCKTELIVCAYCKELTPGSEEKCVICEKGLVSEQPVQKVHESKGQGKTRTPLWSQFMSSTLEYKGGMTALDWGLLAASGIVIAVVFLIYAGIADIKVSSYRIDNAATFKFLYWSIFLISIAGIIHLKKLKKLKVFVSLYVALSLVLCVLIGVIVKPGMSPFPVVVESLFILVSFLLLNNSRTNPFKIARFALLFSVIYVFLRNFDLLIKAMNYGYFGDLFSFSITSAIYVSVQIALLLFVFERSLLSKIKLEPGFDFHPKLEYVSSLLGERNSDS